MAKVLDFPQKRMKNILYMSRSRSKYIVNYSNTCTVEFTSSHNLNKKSYYCSKIKPSPSYIFNSEIISNYSSDEERPSSLRKLKYGLNKGDGITSKLEAFASLLYINVRLCHISTAEVGLLVRLLGNPCSSLTTLILDGLKLSGTSAIKELLGKLNH